MALSHFQRIVRIKQLFQLGEITMTFADIKQALEDMFNGKPETWRDLCADDVRFESIHSSSKGNSVKNKDEMYAMHLQAGKCDADVRCLVETASVISVTHAVPHYDDLIYMNVCHIEDGKIKACYYAKTTR
tara:strand:+ start:651 stop:1043 length:393 start_codon:yes stop_codon:yes gene_type:complete